MSCLILVAIGVIVEIEYYKLNLSNDLAGKAKIIKKE